ncbi:MAG: hypothetical protein ACLFR2_11400 [Candidatus Kapaibacterium sp.]
MKRITIILVIIAGIALGSCTSIKRHDDAVRIKPDSFGKYLVHPETGELRDGTTLKGTVLGLEVVSKPDSCPVVETTPYSRDTYILFLDEKAEAEKKNIERIEIDDIELVGQMFDQEKNQYNNINLFENYNDPTEMRGLRAVSVDSLMIDTCNPCNCTPWSFGMDLDLSLALNIKCPEREFGMFFLELRGGYALYSDFRTVNDETGIDSYFGEIATGFRFGDKRQWGLGLAYFSGVPMHNSYTSKLVNRPVALFHGRYSHPEEKFLGLCARPYYYGQFGISIDELSIDLMEFKYSTGCENCKEYIKELGADGVVPEIDLSLPISFGLGAGLEIPVNKYADLAIDMGFRSIAFGEAAPIAGFSNVPTNRRIYMFLFRLGLTI